MWPLARSAAALRTLALFMCFTATGCAFALSTELPAAIEHGGVINATGLGDVATLPRSAAFFFWGLSDSQVQLYVMWLIGVFYPAGEEQARAVGCFKMVQSFGWCIGFALMPSDRLQPVVQLFLTLGCCAVGLPMACLALPPRASEIASPDHTDHMVSGCAPQDQQEAYLLSGQPDAQ